MLRFIEINHSLLHRLKDNQDGVLASIHNHPHPHPHPPSAHHPSDRKALPLKQYSNKFLRQNRQPQQKQPQKGGARNSRLNNLITKHKFFQKKLVGALGRNVHVCRTEPNENEYKCFMTSNNFFRDREHLRTHTESIHPKQSHTPLLDENQEQHQQHSQVELRLPKQFKVEEISKGKGEAAAGTGKAQGKLQQKISASRALEMYAKIISKDRGQLIEKIKFTNQKKTVREHILESKKNLEICQMNLLQKQQKKLSCVERPERSDKASNTLQKFRKKTRSVDHRIVKEEENFELRGWEN